ncbi:dethiobiotin synthase [Corynebacterium sp. 335C]
MSITIVTGTGTDVGKTVATAALAARELAEGRAPRVVKPAQTGESEGSGDLATVARLTGVDDLHEFARYPEPPAPATAARRAGVELLDLGETARRIGKLDDGRPVLVEGAGGLLVRIAEWTIADLAAELGAPVLVVWSTGLGSLNHAELTVRELERRGLECVGLIGGSLPAEPDLATRCNADDLPAVTGVPVRAWIPAGSGAWPRERFPAEAPGWFAS